MPSVAARIKTGVKLNRYLERVSQIRKNRKTPKTRPFRRTVKSRVGFLILFAMDRQSNSKSIS